MKAFSAFLVAGALAVPAFAQQQYTVMPSAIHASAQPNPGSALVAGELDTLTQYLDRATNGSLTIYTVQDNNGNVFPVTGTNTIYAFLGARYAFSGPVSVEGIVVAYGVKITNGDADSLVSLIFPMANDGSLLPLLGTGSFTSDIIDTSSSSVTLTYIPFQHAMSTTGSFAVAVQTLGLSQTDPSDVVGIFSSQQGDGHGENQGFVLVPQGNGIAVANLSQLPIAFNGAPPDFDPIIMPVIQATGTTDVGETPALNGLALKGAYPSPASDKSTIRIAIDKPSFVEINLLDMTGKAVATVRRDNLAAGDHDIELNVAGLPAGSYLYTVRTSFSGVAGKMTVVK